jgi:hypothetical protein
MKKFAIIALALLVALPASAAGVTISGYLDLGFIAAQGGRNYPTTPNNGVQATTSTNGGWNANDQFVVNELNLDLASQLTNDISMFVSLDSIRGNAVSIDYAYVDFANPGPFDLNVRVGRIPSVVGIEQRASESNQTRFISLSLLSPYTVGAIEGAAIYGSFSPVNYALAVSNADVVGSRLGAVGSALTLLTPGNNNGNANLASYRDQDNGYAFSGRIGVVPIEGLEIGFSGSMDEFDIARTVGSINKSRTLLAADASYAWGAFTLKGEYGAVKEETVNAQADLEGRGYYVEGVYDVNSKWSVGVRYSAIKLENAAVGPTNGVVYDVNTLAVAAVYRVADNVQLKAEYDINGEKVLNSMAVNTLNNPTAKNNVLALSLVASF